MAHQPMLLPDPSERPFLPEGSFAPARGPEWLEEDSGNYLAELAAKLASHGGGESSADLALDLMLNKIVDQARLATAASGAAIALSRDGSTGRGSSKTRLVNDLVEHEVERQIGGGLSPTV